jgi:MYXO-CTERM domain-containing protein
MYRWFAIPSALLALSACTTGTSPTDGDPRSAVPARWPAAIAARLRADAREITADGADFVAVQPASGTVVRFTAAGVTVGARDAASLSLRLTAFGRAGAASAVEAVAPQRGGCAADTLPDGTCARRVEYAYDEVTAWWVGLDDGVEFGWTVDAPPAGAGDLRFTVDVSGAAWLGPDGDGAELVDAGGTAWRVSSALAWDATGAPIPATLSVDGDTLVVDVDDTGAVYPITVDPDLATTAVTFSGGAAGDYAGFAVSGAGDVNGDGYDDVIVGAHRYDSATLSDIGRAYVFHGSSSGVSSTASRTITTSGSGELFGYAVAGVGDVNGDGYDDVLIGAPNGYGSAGVARVFYGAASGLPSSAGTTINGSSAFALFGRSLARAGDVNGDGYDDVVIGAPYHDEGSLTNAGRAYVFHGSSSGLNTTAAQTFTGAAADEYLGRGLAGGGDVNGDGYDDVVIATEMYDDGASADVGFAGVYLGSSSGVASTATVSYIGEAGADYFGQSVSIAGDINDDGYDDLVVGARGYDDGRASKAGRAYVFLGSASGPATTAASTITGGAGDELGYSVAIAGDVNGDGAADVVVGAPNYDTSSATDVGRAYVYHGGATGVASTAAITLTGGASGDALGSAVAGAGDVNADGYADLVIGAYLADVGSAADAGKASIHLGCADADLDGWCASGAPGTGTGTADCDDTDASIGAAYARYVDADGDGYGATTSDVVCVTVAGYADTSDDCDDTRAKMNPAATEVCDADDRDEDCSGAADDADAGVDPTSEVTWYADADADGYGDPATPIAACEAPAGYVADARDCDDDRADISPAGAEVCDAANADDDCDGASDDADPSVASSGLSSWYADSDADGFGGDAASTLACDPPLGYASVGGDCDDARAAVNPAATEVCDADDRDDDCSGAADDEDTAVDPATFATWYADADADGFGDPASPTDACDLPPGYADNAADCDDARAAVNPAATEVCDADDRDEDCTGAADDDDARVDPTTYATWYADLDADGFGNPAITTEACDRPSGYVAAAGDCDDDRVDVSPAASEICDGGDRDEDCDGAPDDADPSVDAATFSTWYADADGDGYGDPASPTRACDLPTMFAGNDADCDDARADVYPGAAEVADDGTDADCDGTTEVVPEKGCACETAGPGAAGPLAAVVGLVLGWRRRRR